MKVIIASGADTPIYQQIFEQVSAQILNGDLPRDFCLPPIRTVAKELRISVITVKRAWEELERAGFIYTMVGKGCFVAPLDPQMLDVKKEVLVGDRLKKEIQYDKKLGLSLEELLALVKKYYEES